MENIQEKKWIRRIKLFGSAKDADLLVRFYYDEVYIFVVRQTDDKEQAYNLTQEILIPMLHSITVRLSMVVYVNLFRFFSKYLLTCGK